jgi:asparagine synthase (glutamine-hydrolysing)
VRFWEKTYDETWAAEMVASHIGSRHTTLALRREEGTWDAVTSLMAHCGQPFADTSVFPMCAMSRLMREHVTVALSGDGGDEGFGGYTTFAMIERAVGLQRFPPGILQLGARVVDVLTPTASRVSRLAQHAAAVARSDDVGIVQHLMSYIPPDEQLRLMPEGRDLLPTRRWFEPQWAHTLPEGSSRIERLSALVTEARIRLALASDYLFKTDIASMHEGLEIRVPFLDEDLVAFGLTLPHHLKVRNGVPKAVLRAEAGRRLPTEVANKRKQGFGIPMDSWVGDAFRRELGSALTEGGSDVAEYLAPAAYAPVVDAFVRGVARPNVSREGLYQRVFMLLAIQVASDSLRQLRRERRGTA